LPCFDVFVTGHYVRTTFDSASGRYLLKKAADEKKDQSYVLYCLTQQQLKMSHFPLGELLKDEVRKIAEEKKLNNAKKSESQDICCVPDGDYGSSIEKYTGQIYPCGDIIDTEGKVIGRHKGLIRCTIGQRRGLGVAANTPLYVCAKSIEANTVTLAADDALYSKSLSAGNINLIACTDLKKPVRVMVKTRYLQTAQAAVAEQTGEDSLHIEFDAPQRAITPGQAAVMYDGDIVVGGGTIRS
jgi:tRNA-specific 2-thiouridylase